MNEILYNWEHTGMPMKTISRFGIFVGDTVAHENYIDISPTKIPEWNWSYKRINWTLSSRTGRPQSVADCLRRAGLFGEKSDKLPKASRGSAECLDSVADSGAFSGRVFGRICRSEKAVVDICHGPNLVGSKGWLWDAIEVIQKIKVSMVCSEFSRVWKKKCKLNYKFDVLRQIAEGPKHISAANMFI